MNTEWMARRDDEQDPVMERELREALQRRAEVPAGFADRVLARAAAAEVPERGRARMLPWRGRQAWAGWAVAAGLTVGVFAGGGAWQRHQADARRCAMATAQFETAERITDRALDQVRAQMERAGVPADAMGDAVGR